MNSLRRSTWAIPAILAFTSLTALILALVAEGVWDWLSWTLLALPPALIIGFWLKK
ncbi:hypothetical protein EI77_00725 [Prosthecobacter fusiformis]|uniref:DUF4175 domain-containing protein n=1 Tax=Prosthecobacter fusiformis TaxID=48464 RepID=A0A4R7ST29_9BACT|nr:hypothetical protein [Prosthecobacter fusiformis]TDU81417.1 hypothetical protein EI77_00725 [Prosthecobacter fusiformis]